MMRTNILLSIMIASCVCVAEEGHLRKNSSRPEHLEPTSGGREVALRTFLAVLGLTRHVGSNATAPQYMLDLYSRIADANGVTREPNARRANIIRSYGPIPTRLRSRLVFDLTGMEEGEQVLQSELHIFKRGCGRNGTTAICKVSVYQMLDDELDLPSNLRLLATHYALSWTSEWLTFQVKTTVVEWTKNKKSNRGFFIKASSLNGDENLQLNLELDYFKNRDNKPLLVVFSSTKKQHSSIKSMPLRLMFMLTNNVIPEASIPASYYIDTALEENAARKHKRSVEASFDEECFKYDMYVDFSEIGWSSWIISPKGYNAYTCRGHCRFPLSQAQRPTNHATVQSIVHELGLHENVSVPCCVPSNLLSISLLYFDEHGNVVIKQYDDMVVEHCGCL